MDYLHLAAAVKDELPAGDLPEIQAFLGTEHPADLAAHLAEWPVDQALRVLALLPIPRQAELFGYFEADDQLELTEHLPEEHLAQLFTEMNADERADLFAELPEITQQALLKRLKREEREDIRRLAAYEEETAGAIMTTDFVSLDSQMTVRDAIESLRSQAPDSETIYRAYVLDDRKQLLGALRLQNLIFARPDRKVSELIEANALAVHVDDDQEEVARHIAKYDVLAVPVVDAENRLLGIITYDDAMDIAEEEATEDIHRVGAVGDLDASVRDAPFFMMYRKRIVWLVLLVFGALFSSGGIAYFEDTIAAYVALVFFLPMLIGSAGNAGSQAATLMVRALAIGDVEMKDWGVMLGKELLVALALGGTMALAVSGIGIFRGGPDVAMVVALTMLIVVIFGSLIGMSLPFLLQRVKVDPATASAPLVATIADAGGVVIYLSIATAMLGLPGAPG